MAQPLKGQWVNLGLVLAALALVVVVVATRERVTTSEKDARSFNLLPAYREDDITRVTIEREGKRLVVERAAADDAGDTTWRITEPVKEEADAFAVDKLLGSLEYARVVRRIKPEEVDREAFGLSTPEWVLRLEMGTIVYTLRLGKEAASPAGARYLDLVTEGTSDSAVVIIGKDLVAELGVDAGQLRGRQLLPYTSNELSRIVLSGSDGTERRLSTLGERSWRFDGMAGGARLDRETFDQVLVQFARTKADQFLALEEAEQAQGKAPAVRLELVPKDPKRPRARVELGGKCPKSDNDIVAIRREPDPAAACVPQSVLAGYDTPVDALVDRHTFWMRKDEVESLRIELDGKQLELDRKESGFILRKPVQGDVELDTGNARLDAIVRAAGTIVDAPDAKKLGLAPPRGKVVIRSAAESDEKVQEEVLELGAQQPDGQLVVRRVADGVVLTLPGDQARALEPDATLVRNRRVLDFASGDLRSIDVETPSLHQKLHREESGVFVLDAPKGFAHDAALCTALADAVSRVTADRWVADQDDGSFGLRQPRARAALSFNAGDASTRQVTLRVGALTTGGAFAALEGEPGVFVLPRSVLDALETWVLDRSTFIVTPDAVTRVELTRAGKTITLETQGNRFVPSAGTELAEGRAQELAEALMALRAEAALHLGPAKPDEGFEKPELTVKTTGDSAATFRIGAGDSWQGTSVHYARRDGVDATFVIAKSKVRVLLDAF